MSGDRINRIRTGLRCVSEEFRNVVVVDLSELKWKTFQMIITTLFPLCSSLSAVADDISHILEKRQRELSTEKTIAASRDERIRSERLFRVDFSQLVIKGLELLRWPTATAAFSNPLNDLIESIDVKLDAIEFILNAVNAGNMAGNRRVTTSSKQIDRAESADYKDIPQQLTVSGKVNDQSSVQGSNLKKNYNAGIMGNHSSYESRESVEDYFASVKEIKPVDSSRQDNDTGDRCENVSHENKIMTSSDYSTMRRVIEVTEKYQPL